jgi:hypothetical protein
MSMIDVPQMSPLIVFGLPDTDGHTDGHGRTQTHTDFFDTPLELLADLERPLASTEEAVENAIAVYKAAKGFGEAYDRVQAAAKALLNEVMAETGQLSWKTPAGSANVTAAGTSVRYDSKAIETLCLADPALGERLAPFRTVVATGGVLVVR